MKELGKEGDRELEKGQGQRQRPYSVLMLKFQPWLLALQPIFPETGACPALIPYPVQIQLPGQADWAGLGSQCVEAPGGARTPGARLVPLSPGFPPQT